MAVKKVKRIVPGAQPRAQAATTPTYDLPRRKVVQFLEAKDKSVERVEFSTEPGSHNIGIRFKDKTSLNFEIETSFTVRADYSDFTDGNERILRRWKPLRSFSRYK